MQEQGLEVAIADSNLQRGGGQVDNVKKYAKEKEMDFGSRTACFLFSFGQLHPSTIQSTINGNN